MKEFIKLPKTGLIINVNSISQIQMQDDCIMIFFNNGNAETVTEKDDIELLFNKITK